MSSDATTITQLYEQIPLEAMQQVADSYMAWYVEKVTREFDGTITRLRTELEENDKQEALFKPSAAELEAMRRLQSNKVTDVDLLDRLVERGEEWLVLTMHRLDYFERAGLSPNDYPAWCEHALSGAYDWIDSGRLHASKRMFSLQGGATGPMRAVRPADLAAINASKAETTGQQRVVGPAAARPVTQPQRAAPPAAPRPTPAPRAQEVSEPSTQPVPAIAQSVSAVPEQVTQKETAPLPVSAPRPEAPPRPAAPIAQAPGQRAPAPPAQNLSDTPTRPTPAAPAQKPPALQQYAPATQPAGGAPMPPPQRRPDQPSPVPRPQPSAAAQPQPQQPYAAAQRPHAASSWGASEQHPDPRYSLDDVEVEDLEEEGEDQGLIRKIFRVFTG